MSLIFFFKLGIYDLRNSHCFFKLGTYEIEDVAATSTPNMPRRNHMSFDSDDVLSVHTNSQDDKSVGVRI